MNKADKHSMSELLKTPKLPDNLPPNVKINTQPLTFKEKRKAAFIRPQPNGPNLLKFRMMKILLRTNTRQKKMFYKTNDSPTNHLTYKNYHNIFFRNVQ